MKLMFLFYLLLCLLSILFCLRSKSRSFTDDPSKLEENEIIKILNMENRTNDSDIESEEADTLKSKMKKADLDNFEVYLDSYIRFLKNLRKWKEIQRKDNFTRNHSCSNSSALQGKNKSEADNTSKVQVMNHTVGKEKNITYIPTKEKKNDTEKLHNKKVQYYDTINKFFMDDEEAFNTRKLPEKKISNHTRVMYNHSEHRNPHKFNSSVNYTSSTANHSILSDNHTVHIVQRQLANDNHSHYSQKESVSSTAEMPHDQIYNNLKTVTLNEDFERREVETEIQKKEKKFLNDEKLEYNVFKRIINISVSIIVIGLLMGVLLGLILVMYLNSRK